MTAALAAEEVGGGDVAVVLFGDDLAVAAVALVAGFDCEHDREEWDGEVEELHCGCCMTAYLEKINSGKRVEDAESVNRTE